MIMSLTYTRHTGSLFRLTKSQNLIYCGHRTFCKDPPSNNVSKKELPKSEASGEEKSGSEKLKIEELLKSFSQSSSRQKLSKISEIENETLNRKTLKGKLLKNDDHDNKKFKQHTQNVESDFFASLKAKKNNVFSKDDKEKEEGSNEKIQSAKLKMSELLKSLSKMPDSTTSKISLTHPKPRKKNSELKNESFQSGHLDIDLSLKKAVKDVAKEYTGDTQEIESDLFASLKSHSTETSLSDLLATMKIDRSPASKTSARSHKPSSHKSFNDFRQDEEEIPLRSRLNDFRRKEFRKPIQVDICSGAPLDIFTKDCKGEVTSILPTWDLIHDRQKEAAVTNFPRNAFEEMIQWTKEGKLWTFPIDNEIGLEEEKKYGFADHIFLERHLEAWCPKKGPIRRYMELVCTGLSKNPYLTVNRKKAHIEWYKNYFEEKKILLKEIGAM